MKTDHYQLNRIKVGTLEVNCYLLSDIASRETLIIDPGDNSEGIMRLIVQEHLQPVGIVNTHGHFDHIGANAVLKETYGIPLYIHAADVELLQRPACNGSAFLRRTPVTSPAPDVQLNDGSRIAVGKLEVSVLHTPGHSKGCICLLVEDLAFTGDTLFCGDIGRCDLFNGDEKAMMSSLERLRRLPPETRILPGHGPECLLKSELRHNPYLCKQA